MAHQKKKKNTKKPLQISSCSLRSGFRCCFCSSSSTFAENTEMLKSSLEGWKAVEVLYILDFQDPEYRIGCSEGIEERDRDIFTRVRIVKRVIDTNHFKLTIVAPTCYPRINYLNWGRNKEKIKHVSQGVHEMFFPKNILFLLLL